MDNNLRKHLIIAEKRNLILTKLMEKYLSQNKKKEFDAMTKKLAEFIDNEFIDNESGLIACVLVFCSDGILAAITDVEIIDLQNEN